MGNYNNNASSDTVAPEDKSGMADPEGMPEQDRPVLVPREGYEGDYDQVAAEHFFGNETSVICCATFGEVIRQATNKKESEGAVMAIENSIAGSILPNYNLLQKSRLK